MSINTNSCHAGASAYGTRCAAVAAAHRLTLWRWRHACEPHPVSRDRALRQHPRRLPTMLPLPRDEVCMSYSLRCVLALGVLAGTWLPGAARAQECSDDADCRAGEVCTA